MLTALSDDAVVIASRIPTKDGVFPTAIPFLSFIRASYPTALGQGMLTPSMCLVLQGGKRILIGSDVLHYGAGSYVVAALDMPTSAQIVDVSPSCPYLGIRIDLDPKEVASIAAETKISWAASNENVRGAYVGQSDPDLRAAVFRLVDLLGRPYDVSFLANSVKQEIIYHLLTAEQGGMLYRNVLPDDPSFGVGRAIEWIKANYARPMRIEALAGEISMSVSALHHRFKAITTMSPLQYQKRLRLLEARRLLLAGDMDAATAGFTVGYESPSQFSREYRRLFGAPPLRDVDALKKSSERMPVQD